MADMVRQAKGKERRLNKSRKTMEKKLVLVKEVAPLDNSRLESTRYI